MKQVSAKSVHGWLQARGGMATEDDLIQAFGSGCYWDALESLEARGKIAPAGRRQASPLWRLLDAPPTPAATAKPDPALANPTPATPKEPAPAAERASMPPRPRPAPAPRAPEQDALAVAHLPLVKHIAARLAMGLPSHVDIDDLISYGTFGLLDAAAKFDPARGVKFKTYAYTRIKGAIVDGLREVDWAPASLRQNARRLDEVIWALEGELGRSPTESEIAQAMQVQTHELQAMKVDMERAAVLSLDEVWSGEGEDGEFTLADVVAGPSEDPAAADRQPDERRVLHQALGALPERERYIMVALARGYAPKEVADVLRLSVSRVSQLQSKAIRRLQVLLGAPVRTEPAPTQWHSTGHHPKVCRKAG